jgi:hypothetical protein
VLQGGGGGPGRGGTPAGVQSVLVEGGSGSIQRFPIDQRMRALARVFKVASEEVGVSLPLCADCAGDVHKELEAQLGELQQVRGRAMRAVACSCWLSSCLEGWLRPSVPLQQQPQRPGHDAGGERLR